MKITVNEKKSESYVNALYEALLDGNYFTEAELVLVTDGWGLNEDTLDRICQVRFGMDADQLIAEGASEKKQEDGAGPKKPYTVIVKAEVTSRESVRATDPAGAERLAKMKVIERCSGVYNEAEVDVTSAKASLVESKNEDAPWEPTMKKIRDLKKDEYFTLRPVEEPKESQVWVMDSYDRGERKWYAYKFADVNDGRYFSGDKEVCTGFTF